jgi:hypothetical protein
MAREQVAVELEQARNTQRESEVSHEASILDHAKLMRAIDGVLSGLGVCRMDLSGPTTSVGTKTDYSVGPWDYPACATRRLMA